MLQPFQESCISRFFSYYAPRPSSVSWTLEKTNSQMWAVYWHVPETFPRGQTNCSAAYWSLCCACRNQHAIYSQSWTQTWTCTILRSYFNTTKGYWSQSFLYVAATLFCYNHGTHAVKCQYTLKQIIYVPIQTCTDNDITIHAHTCWYVPIHTLSIHTNISHSSEHHLKVEPQTLSLQDTALTALTALSTHGG